MKKWVLVVLTISFSENVLPQQCSLLLDFRGWNYWEQSSGEIKIDGDANGDGYDDVIISAGFLDYGGKEDIGAAFVFSGMTGDTLFIFSGEAALVYFGSSVAWAGDVNYDGYDDFIIGSPGYGPSSTGRAYVFSGLDGDTLHVFGGESEYSAFGSRVASAGDVDNDGHDDIIIGAYRYSNFRGRAYVFSGSSGSPLFVFTGTGEGENFGRNVSSAGDVNHDGFKDIMVSTYSNIYPFINQVCVFSGLTGDTLYLFSAEYASFGFGASMACAGDVNGDWYDDIIIGDPTYPGGGVQRGRVYVFSGADGDTLEVRTGEHDHDAFGRVSAVGDLDKDGYDDYLVAASDYIAGDSGAVGRIYVFSGWSGDTLQLLTGTRYYERSGWFSPSAGDVNGDEYNDLAFGSFFFYDDVEEYLTRFTVYPAISCRGNRGDINGDLLDADIIDLSILVDRIFRSGQSAPCFAESDANSDSSHGNILDLNFLVNFLFRNGAAPGPCY